MKVALVNPPWRFDGSVYFGCREPHLPLELGYAKALLERAGHEAALIDAQARGIDLGAVRAEVATLRPDITVITTAPSYLFWRCPPPELRVPMAAAAALRGHGGLLVAVGPHGSATPRAALRKLGVDVVVLGECEEILVLLAGTPESRFWRIPSIAYRRNGVDHVQGGPYAACVRALPALRWDAAAIARHAHHHNRFDAVPDGPSAEMETSRGCPRRHGYGHGHRGTSCAKETSRDWLRRRPLETVLDELDALLAQGVRHVYFIDELFLPDRALLEALCARDVVFGVQLRIDGWSREMLDLLGRAGCVSIEADVEGASEEGSGALARRCGASTEELTALLVHARRSVPFVQANLSHAGADDPAEAASWRQRLLGLGVWANEPVPTFPYPGSPAYARRWGAPDDGAWERAHAHYIAEHRAFGDLQDSRPLPLAELEHGAR
ncbi:TIGR04295 family B12-binding domain-containing radical SAM protein [Sorangium sp. So ce1078]|uniref:TIGR04295 family B12-binding domain-containing radical SAM protein n=1 Tax=Sorangium sp. So ce1078 TaxID=3133329 RepID=UPI003F5D75AE